MSFSKEELKRIETAVENLESKFPMEIVPVFTEKSGAYHISRFRALLLATISAFILMFFLNEFTALAWYPSYVVTMLGVIWVVLALVISEFIPAISRKLAGKEFLRDVTFSKAKEEYIIQEVYSNPNRIGVMIFVSFYEHQFHILCDKKGSQFFGDEEWLAISKELIISMRAGKPCESIEHCINAIGEVMAREVAEDDDLPPSILPNNLRYE